MGGRAGNQRKASGKNFGQDLRQNHSAFATLPPALSLDLGLPARTTRAALRGDAEGMQAALAGRGIDPNLAQQLSTLENPNYGARFAKNLLFETAGVEVPAPVPAVETPVPQRPQGLLGEAQKLSGALLVADVARTLVREEFGPGKLREWETEGRVGQLVRYTDTEIRAAIQDGRVPSLDPKRIADILDVPVERAQKLTSIPPLALGGPPRDPLNVIDDIARKANEHRQSLESQESLSSEGLRDIIASLRALESELARVRKETPPEHTGLVEEYITETRASDVASVLHEKAMEAVRLRVKDALGGAIRESTVKLTLFVEQVQSEYGLAKEGAELLVLSELAKKFKNLAAREDVIAFYEDLKQREYRVDHAQDAIFRTLETMPAYSKKLAQEKANIFLHDAITWDWALDKSPRNLELRVNDKIFMFGKGIGIRPGDSAYMNNIDMHFARRHYFKAEETTRFEGFVWEAERLAKKYGITKEMSPEEYANALRAMTPYEIALLRWHIVRAVSEALDNVQRVYEDSRGAVWVNGIFQNQVITIKLNPVGNNAYVPVLVLPRQPTFPPDKAPTPANLQDAKIISERFVFAQNYDPIALSAAQNFGFLIAMEL